MLLQHDYMPLKVMIPHFGYYRKIVGVEIGMSTGCGSLTMLLQIPDLTLYSIDPWRHLDDVPGEEHFEAALPQKELDNAYEVAKARVAEFGARSIIIRKPSDEAVNDVPDKIDYLFIDGDHSYKQALSDIKNYGPKVRAGGIVAGHDYIKQGGVARAVDEIFKKETVHLGDDDTWWVYV
jgi:predicted O-methyltransferase YrrM